MFARSGVVDDVKAVNLCGVAFAPWTEREVVAHVMDSLAGSRQHRGGWIFTPNVDILRAVVTRPEMRRVAQRATLVVADGMPLVWASSLRGTPLPERVTGASLLGSLCAAAAEQGRSVFLLGGAEGVSEEAARRISADHPNLKISGWSPPFGLEATAEGMDQIKARVVSAKADLVFCGFGFPKQERIIAQFSAILPETWFIGCGASLAFAAGQVNRAPAWMQKSGLEWFHRLCSEPRRMFRRYVVNDIPFAVRLLAAASLHGLLVALAGTFASTPTTRTLPAPPARHYPVPSPAAGSQSEERVPVAAGRAA